MDPPLLHKGAAHAHNAGEHAQNGVNRLARTVPEAGMFGDFGAADVFQRLITAAHAHHVTKLGEHSEALGAIGDKADWAAATWVDTEEARAAEMRNVRP